MGMKWNNMQLGVEKKKERMQNRLGWSVLLFVDGGGFVQWKE
jgi:hypothetical protein